MQGGPVYRTTLLDYLLAGGCVGLLVLGTTLVGMLVCVIVLATARRSRAILIPVILSAVPFGLGLLGTGWGFWMTNTMVARQQAEGAPAPDPAELADARLLAWSTTITGSIGGALLLGFALLAALVKRPDPPAGDAA